jgi:peptidoglycan-associated lipoprotein
MMKRERLSSGGMHMLNRMLRLLAVACLAVTVVSCGPANKRRKRLSSAGDQASDAEKAPAYTPGVDVTEASLRGSEFSGVPDLASVQFDYDSYSLPGESLERLKKNAAYLNEHRDLEVLVSGHCDERGTNEYNLALGQNRAKEVREYYIRLGVSGGRIATISYGEENALCSEATEDCWSSNRRAETRVRSRTASAGTPNSNTR